MIATGFHRLSRRRSWMVALALLACAAASAPAVAQPDEEIEAARARLQMLMHEAEELEEAGRIAAARRKHQEARRLEALIDRHERREEKRADPRARLRRLHEIMEHLEHGMVALRELGRHEELERLEHVARDLREEIGAVEARVRGERREGDDGARRERAIAERQVETLRLAIRALREAERGDAADRIEHAIHARELALAGRRDEEARRVRETAPGRGEIVELLTLAEHLYREFDRPDRARALSRATEELWPARRAGARERDPGGDGRAARERFMHRFERLEERVERIEDAIEHVRDELAETVEMVTDELQEVLKRVQAELERHDR